MTPTTRLHLDRIASSTRHAGIGRDVLIGPRIVCREGYVLAVRILNDKSTYNRLEIPTGRLVRLRAGDTMAGVLGTRRALRGYAGVVPEVLEPGDTVNVLNMGGVLGLCTAGNPDLGAPFEAEVLGAVLTFPPTGDRIGRPASIRAEALEPAERLTARVPVIYVAGTCMNSGKTVAAAELVRGLSREGLRVGAVKLTGVSLRRDALAMEDAGALAGMSFDDAGVVSTREEDVLPVARALLNHLAASVKPDVVVAELGDGILGEYGVGKILADRELMGLCAALVVAAPDQVGAWGAHRVLGERFGLTVAAITGPATDNEVGTRFVREALGIPAHNARREPEALVALALEALRGRR